MIGLVIKWVVNALSLYLVAQILPGFDVTDFYAALIAALVIGLVNTFLKPILHLLTFPITIVTLGLFTFIINALLLWLASSLVSGFSIDGFMTAIIGSVLLTIISTILNSLVK